MAAQDYGKELGRLDGARVVVLPKLAMGMPEDVAASMREIKAIEASKRPPSDPGSHAEGALVAYAAGPEGGEPFVLVVIDPHSLSQAPVWVYQLPPQVPVRMGASGRCLIVPALDGSEDVYALVLIGGASLDGLARALVAADCPVDGELDELSAAAPAPRAVQVASQAAGAAEVTGTTAAKAIGFAGGLVAWGIKKTAKAAVNSQMLPTMAEPLELHPQVRQSAGTAREVSRKVADVSETVIGKGAEVVGNVSAGVVEKVDKATNGFGAAGEGEPNPAWTGAKLFGSAAVMAGIEVVNALGEATQEIYTAGADASAEVVGHSLGDEAGETVRDGLYTGGNILEVRSKFTKKALAKVAGSACASGVVQELSSPRVEVSTPSQVSPSVEVSTPSQVDWRDPAK